MSPLSERLSGHLPGKCILMLLLLATPPAWAKPEPIMRGSTTIWELDAASVAALIEIIPDAGRFEFRFSETPQLLLINAGDIIRLPPTAELPSGHEGPVLAYTAGAGEVLIETRFDRFTGAMQPVTIGATLHTTTVPVDPADAGVACEIEGIAEDTNNDGDDDGGFASGRCEGSNGGDHGFRLVLAEGVEINGVLTVTPSDLDVTINFADDEHSAMIISNRSRLSFTGEISARFDHELPDDPIDLGEFPVASYDLVIPNIGTINVSLTARAFIGATGSIKAGAKAGMTMTGDATFGLTWADGAVPNMFSETGESGIQLSPPELDADTGMDITLYGGASVSLSTTANYAGVLPLIGNEATLSARGSARLLVEPMNDPWWQISGKPEMYLDVDPFLLFANLDNFNFQVIDPTEVVFFTSNDEFPFPTRAGGARSAGDVLRWARSYHGDDDFTTADVAPTGDGGALAVGSDSLNGYVLRSDRQGDRLWQRRFFGYLPESVIELDDGRVVVAGLRNIEIWIMTFDANGVLLSAREYEIAEGTPTGVTVARPAAGSSVLRLGGEYLDDTGILFRTPYAMRIADNGNVISANGYGMSGSDKGIHAMAGTDDGGMILVGETDQDVPVVSNGGLENAYTLRLAPDDSVLWANVWASSSTDRLFAVDQDSDGGFLAAGKTAGIILNSAPRGLLLRYDADDMTVPTEPRWDTAISPVLDTNLSLDDEIRAVAATSGGFLVGGNSQHTGNGKAWFAKVTERDGKPDLVWSSYHDGADDDAVAALHDIGDGMLTGGHSASFGPGLPGDTDSLWLARLPYDSYMHWNAASGAQASYTLLANRQAPFYSAVPALNFTDSLDVTAQEQKRTLNVTVTDADSAELHVEIVGFSQVELVRDDLPMSDTDGDGIDDDVDNCTNVVNTDQRDSNGDGFGNLCDTDLNGDGATNAIDLGLFKSVFFTPDEDADFNGDGVVNAIDLGLLKSRFFQAPGPSGIVD